MIKINIIKGDITESSSDAIVNAANETLLGGGGVDGAIHHAAGPELLAECQKLNGCFTGEAKITKGYKLKAKYVIHTPGPRYYSHQDHFKELLTNSYINSLKLAEEYKLKSISFPCISTGAFGYKGDEIETKLLPYHIAIDAIISYDENTNHESVIEECNIYAYDDFSYKALDRYLYFKSMNLKINQNKNDDNHESYSKVSLFKNTIDMMDAICKPYTVLGYNERDELYYIGTSFCELNNVFKFLKGKDCFQEFGRNKTGDELIEDLTEKMDMLLKEKQRGEGHKRLFESYFQIVKTFDVFFVINQKLDFFAEAPSFYLFSNMWSYSNPWEAIRPIGLERIEDISRVKAIEYLYD